MGQKGSSLYGRSHNIRNRRRGGIGIGEEYNMCSNMEEESAAEIKEAIYAHYPGLEQQLQMAFTCHDLNNDQILPYSTLEPVLRHLFLQYGLIEYITRFSNSQGALDLKYVEKDFNKFSLKLNGGCCGNYLTCENFKSLAVIWLKKILDTYADDQAEWMEKLRESQEEQSEAYMKALKCFEEKFVLQQSLYKQAIEEQEKQIADWNKILEDAQRSQQEVYEAEVKRKEDIKSKEENALILALKEKQRILDEYTSQITKMAKEDKSAICFTYPSSCTPYGACVSAGAQEPIRRKRKKINKNIMDRHDKTIPGCC